MNITAKEARALADGNSRVDKNLEDIEMLIEIRAESGKYNMSHFFDKDDSRDVRKSVIEEVRSKGFEVEEPLIQFSSSIEIKIKW